MDAAVSVDHVNHYYGENELRRQVLYDICAEIRTGEIVILTGPSGSGKTTLLTLMGALRSAQEGSVRVLGRELRGASEATLAAVRKRIGYIFQAHNLLEALSARQNVRLSLELHDELTLVERNQRVVQALEAVGMGDRLEARPSEISGGQRQRVAIARALAPRPQIILADEPTASLDKETGRSVVDLIQKLARSNGVTVVLVTHDNRILDVADRILALEDGRLSSLMDTFTADAERLFTTLSRDIQRGEIGPRLAGLDAQGFVSVLDQVTVETKRLLQVVDMIQSDAVVSMLGQILAAFTAKTAEMLGADGTALLFLDDDGEAWWSMTQCEHGQHHVSERPGVAGASVGLRPEAPAHVLRVPVVDSRGRPFAAVEVVNYQPSSRFEPAQERRLRELCASLAVILESWWRMGCRCRTAGVGRMPACCAEKPGSPDDEHEI